MCLPHRRRARAGAGPGGPQAWAQCAVWRTRPAWRRGALVWRGDDPRPTTSAHQPSGAPPPAMKTTYLLAAILTLSVIAALMASRALKTGALLAVAALALLGLLNLHGLLR